MNCKFCRKTIEDDSVYCRFCGRKCSESWHRHANGTGTVYKRGNTYTVRIREFANGKHIDRTKGGFRTKKEAYQYADTLMRRNDHKIGFVELWEKYKDSEKFKKLSPAKQNQRDIAYRKLKSLESVKDVRTIEYGQLQDLISDKTHYVAKDMKQVLSSMFDLGMRYKLCETNPAALLELPQLHEKERQIFTDNELAKIWKSENPFKDYVLIMCYTGLRPIELRMMEKKDINLEKRYVTAGRKTELGKASRIAFPDAILPMMERFETPNGTKVTFEKHFRDFLASLGITGKTPYCCRHTFVTNLSKVTDSIAILKSAARHTDYQTTLRYTHLNTDEVASVVNKLSTLSLKTP